MAATVRKCVLTQVAITLGTAQPTDLSRGGPGKAMGVVLWFLCYPGPEMGTGWFGLTGKCIGFGLTKLVR